MQMMMIYGNVSVDGKAFGGTALPDRHRIRDVAARPAVVWKRKSPPRLMPTKLSRWNGKQSERKTENIDENDTIIGNSSSGCRRSIGIEAESEVSESR